MKNLDLFNVLTFSEASKRWGINDSTLRKKAQSNSSEFIENVDFRKSGNTWLVTVYAMERLYGKEGILIKKKS